MQTEGLGKFLQQKRIAAGLSQIIVAEKLGYSTAQFVSNWERSLAKPPVKALAKLVKLYRMDSEEMLDHYILTTKKRLEAVLKARKKTKSKSW